MLASLGSLLSGSGEWGVGGGGVLDSLPHDGPALAPVETSTAGVPSRILPDPRLPKRAEPKAGAESGAEAARPGTERVPPHSR